MVKKKEGLILYLFCFADMFEHLPTEIKSKIFSYDPTYHHIFEQVLRQFKRCIFCEDDERREIEIMHGYVFENRKRIYRKGLGCMWYCCYSCLENGGRLPKIWKTQTFSNWQGEVETDGEEDSSDDEF